MKKKAKEVSAYLKDAIEESLSDDKLTPQDVIDICNDILQYVEDEKMGMEDFLKEDEGEI